MASVIQVIHHVVVHRLLDFVKQQERLTQLAEMVKCLDVCENSCFHWARECPHSFENNNFAGYSTESGKQEVRNESVQLLLFMGYTDGGVTSGNKLQTLVENSYG